MALISSLGKMSNCSNLSQVIIFIMLKFCTSCMPSFTKKPPDITPTPATPEKREFGSSNGESNELKS